MAKFLICKIGETDGEWTLWDDWQTCSVTCGGGQMTRIRTCLGVTCSGFGEDFQACNEQDCSGTYMFYILQTR